MILTLIVICVAHEEANWTYLHIWEHLASHPRQQTLCTPLATTPQKCAHTPEGKHIDYHICKNKRYCRFVLLFVTIFGPQRPPQCSEHLLIGNLFYTYDVTSINYVNISSVECAFSFDVSSFGASSCTHILHINIVMDAFCLVSITVE